MLPLTNCQCDDTLVPCWTKGESFSVLFNDHPREEPDTSSPPPNTPDFFKSNAIGFYIMLALLVEIKKTVGLEAMLEYIAHYMRDLEQHNPELRDAVRHVLGHMNVEKMYREVTRNDS